MTVISSFPQTPPHSIEAEQQVLGSLLLSIRGLSEVQGRGGDRLFYDPVHHALYSLICEKERRAELVSPVSLAEWANVNSGMKELGGAAYLVRMAGCSVSASQLPHYCELLSDLSAKRGVLNAMNEAQQSIMWGDQACDAILFRLDAAIATLDVQGQAKTVSMLKATALAIEQAIAARDGDFKGLVPTGIASLDNLVHGFRSGELVLLGGRPSMGKTSIALNVALNAARKGHPVIICSLEMNPEAMAVRAISEQTAQNSKAVSYRDILGGEIADWEMEAVTEAAKEISALPIQFLTREFSDIGSMKAGVVQAQKALGQKAALLVIDYAQLLKTSSKSRYEQITEISIELKSLAGKMGFPILALSQLSRALEQREDKRPILSDLRESGQLEQDADTVIFCYRDQYYLERDKPDVLDAEAYKAWQNALARSQNCLEIIVAKQRQGPIGTASVMCDVSLNYVWERN